MPQYIHQLRKRVFIPLSLIVLSLLSLIIASVYYLQNRQIEHENQARLNVAADLLPIFIKGKAGVLEAMAARVAENPALLEALLRRDRETLRTIAEPLLADMRTRFKITRFYFINPDRTVLLRVHKPEKYGDTVHHVTLEAAIAEGGPASGLELGKLGTLSLRLDAPWVAAGKTAGFLELASNVKLLIPDIEKIIEGRVFLGIDKEIYERTVAGAGNQETDRRRIDDLIIMSGNARHIPPPLRDFMSRPRRARVGKSISFSDKGRDFISGSRPLFGTGGGRIGDMFITHDVTLEQGGLRRLVNNLVLITLFFGGLLAALFFYYMGKTEARIRQDQERLTAERDAHRKTARELEDYKDRLEEKVAEKTKALTEEAAVREKAELTARQAARQWERTFDAMPDVVTIHDQDMRIVRANRATREVLGIDWRELIGHYCYKVFGGLDAPCAGCPEALAMTDLDYHSGEITHAGLDKTFLVSASPLLDDNGALSGFIHIAKDITKERALEAQLRQAQKLEAVGTLAGGVAHDFNNILTGIIGYTEFALMDCEHESKAKKDINEVLVLAKRGANLVRQLLAFTRRQTIETQPVDPNVLITDLSKMIKRLIGEDIEYEFIAGPETGHIKADPGQIEQAVVNLVVNARDAMPEGGRITVKTGNTEIDGHTAQVFMVTPGSFVLISVTDTGTGMDQATQKKMFEPFFTTKDVGKGTGLGLATVYGIVKQHRGYITVASAIGRGTTFNLHLPRIEAGHDLRPEKTAENNIPVGTETILLAEDEKQVRNMSARILENLGYTVLKAADAKEAEAVFDRHADEIDILLTDVVMPKGNGRDLYERLARKKPGLKVLFMSGYTDMDLEEKDAAFIQKPFTPQKLATALRKAMEAVDG